MRCTHKTLSRLPPQRHAHVLLDPLSKAGDLVQEVLHGDDGVLHHVDLLHQPLLLSFLQDTDTTTTLKISPPTV